MSGSSGLILISFCLLALFTAHLEGTSCFSYSGLEWPNQQLCPGSDACCGVKDTCMPNRLCKSPDNRDNILVRGPCLSYPYDRSNCAQICVFNETTSNTGFIDQVFPRVEICDSNTYCCRLGTASCCDSSIGKVYLDDNGILLSAAPSKTSSTSVESSTETTSTTATTASSSGTVFATTTSAPSQDPTSTNSASESAAADESSTGGSETLAFKVGLGVGIPLAAIVAGLATWLIFRKRRNKSSNVSELPVAAAYPYNEGHDGYAKSGTYTPHAAYRSSSPAGRNEMHEMPARPDEGWDGNPRELVGSEVRGGQYR